MTTIDTSEKDLKSLIVAAMAGEPARLSVPGSIAEASALYGGTCWILGHWQDYDRESAVDLVQLQAFLEATQPEAAAMAVDLAPEGPTRRGQALYDPALGRQRQVRLHHHRRHRPAHPRPADPRHHSFRRWLTDAVFDLTSAQPSVASYL